MSRGFVKEDDQEEIPLVPPRADLPAGADNWVTPEGLQALRNERATLITEQEDLDPSQEREYRIAFNHINAKLQLLDARISSAKIIDISRFPEDQVHFGAAVTFRNTGNAKVHTFKIVGVDEANIAEGKIAFTTPLAKALMHQKAGGKTLLKLGATHSEFEIINIRYS